MSKQKKTSIGGQALLEGIMMRGPEWTAMAVRDPDGNMIIEKFPTKGKERGKFFRIPFIRGIFNMIDSLTFGYKCLMRSAEIAGLEDESDGKAKKPEAVTTEQSDALASATEEQEKNEQAEQESVTDNAEQSEQETLTAQNESKTSEPEKDPADAESEQARLKKEKKQKAQSTMIMIVSVVLGLTLAVGLFLYLPSQVTKWLSGPLPFLENQIWKSVFEGVMRIIIFVGYMVAVSFMKDIRRTFMYHGAEHKTIFCYENGLPLTVENVRKQKRCHPRCGTSFMILILLVGIIVSMFITADNPIIRTVIKLACMPVVVGIGYELIKLAGRYDNIFTKIISAPGKLLQLITTVEPDDDMIECAIAAFEEVVPDDESDNW